MFHLGYNPSGSAEEKTALVGKDRKVELGRFSRD